MTREPRPEILALTSLRAFAAMHVVLYHVTGELGGAAARTLPVPVANVLGCGQSAVSFFFVLSGFILAYTYCESDGAMRSTRARFWRARFARIYPLYFASFVLDAPRAVGYFVESSSSHAAAFTKTAIAGAGFLTLVQSWFPRITNSWNTPGWSLSTEAFFYATFPWIVVATRRWPARRIIACGLGCWALIVATYPILAALRPSLAEGAWFQTAWRSFPPLRLPEFVLGVGIGRLYVSGESTAVDRWIGAAAVSACALLAAIFACRLGLPQALVANSLEAPLFAIVILGLARGRVVFTGWLRRAPWVLLGRSSYAVYIFHQPFKTWFVHVATALGILPSPLLLIAYVLSLQAFCLAAFMLIEDPVRRLLTSAPAVAPA